MSESNSGPTANLVEDDNPGLLRETINAMPAAGRIEGFNVEHSKISLCGARIK